MIMMGDDEREAIVMYIYKRDNKDQSRWFHYVSVSKCGCVHVRSCNRHLLLLLLSVGSCLLFAKERPRPGYRRFQR